MLERVVGRDHVLAEAEGLLFFGEARFGVVVLEGEAGIGKTTVWRELVRRAGEHGVRVLSCRPAEAETKLAFSALGDLLEDVSDEMLATIPDVSRRALEVALLRAEPGGERLEQHSVAAALRALLENLAAESQLIVAVDDVHWIDPTSAMALGFTLRRLTGVPVGWLLSRRSGEPTLLDVEELVGADAVSRIQIGPLTLAALHHLLRERTEEPLTRPALARIHAASGGYPLYALELARELERVGAGDNANPVPVPDDLRKLISTRVRRLPERTRDALLACAALSEPTTELVDESALIPAEEEEFVSVDASGRISFSHPLYPWAVYASAARARRRELHAGLAAQVADPEERARHLALASEKPGEDVAAALEQGAASARSRGAWASAGELLEHAARLSPADGTDEVRRRSIAAAEHHTRAGDRPRARALLEAELVQPMPAALRAEALLLLGEISYNDRSFDEAKRLLTEALEHAQDPRRAAAIELQLAYIHSDASDYAGGIEHARRALEMAEAGGDQGLFAEALASCAVTEFASGLGLDWDKVERALAREDRDRATPLQYRPTALAGLLLLWVDRFPEAREFLFEIGEWVRERGDEAELSYNLCWRSWLEARCGDFPAALELADEAEAAADLTGSRQWSAFALGQRAFAYAHLGEAENTRNACSEAAQAAEELGQAIVTVWVVASLALLELSVGDAEAAWRACEPFVGLLEEHGIGEPVTVFFVPEAIEAMVALGARERAEELLGDWERRGRELDRPWVLATASRCRGLLNAARGDLDGATKSIERALAEHERIEMPFARARTQLVAGAVARRQRRRRDAKQSFEEALQIFEHLGARLWAERCRSELERVGLRQVTGDELTVSERRTAELVATGLTNREAAEQLFVSPKTVEAALGRVYRKLGIRSRAELGARMGPDVQK